MKVIFLDIDGVLNTDAKIRETGTPNYIDRDAVKLLNAFLASTGAVLVIASDWRFLDDTEILLDEAGVAPRHPDRLSRAVECRREAARAWIAAHDVEAWVALDDHRIEMWDGELHRCVGVNGKVGLTARDLAMANRILASQEIDPDGRVARIIRAALPTASDDQVNEIARECWRAARG